MIHFFTFTLRCKLSDISPILCHWSLTPVVNLPPVTLILVETGGVVDTGVKFAAGVVDTRGVP